VVKLRLCGGEELYPRGVGFLLVRFGWGDLQSRVGGLKRGREVRLQRNRKPSGKHRRGQNLLVFCCWKSTKGKKKRDPVARRIFLNGRKKRIGSLVRNSSPESQQNRVLGKGDRITRNWGGFDVGRAERPPATRLPASSGRQGGGVVRILKGPKYTQVVRIHNPDQKKSQNPTTVKGKGGFFGGRKENEGRKKRNGKGARNTNRIKEFGLRNRCEGDGLFSD